jgi:hypothetical protein
MTNKFVQRVGRAIQRPFLTMKYAMRIVRGRWYVFRDAPDWFVAENSVHLESLAGIEEDPRLVEFYRQASEEFDMRVKRLDAQLAELQGQLRRRYEAKP